MGKKIILKTDCTIQTLSHIGTLLQAAAETQAVYNFLTAEPGRSKSQRLDPFKSNIDFFERTLICHTSIRERKRRNTKGYKFSECKQAKINYAKYNHI